ncbi:MAG: glycosyltransferase [Ignavibacteriaceae bacterium]|nr:glycosyltransferase [Ignavibacteriaceae bacterium]MCK6615927.1 glycosyltransferase [Ignavibacteriaceae bacterium]
MERVVVNLSNYLCNAHDVVIITLSGDNCFYKTDDRVKVFSPEKVNDNILIKWINLFSFFRKTLINYRPDVIYGFGDSYNSFYIVASGFLGIPIFVSNRSSPDRSMHGFRKYINPIFYPFAKGIIIQTEIGIKAIKKFYPLNKFFKVPNPIDTDLFKYSDSDRENIIINVGYLGLKKNQDLLIKFFEKLKINNKWKLIFIGEGPDRAKIEALIADKKLSECVYLLGTRNDVPELLAKSKIFAFTSTLEGFPNALGEAMAAGCACISFDCKTGPSELIDDGINGFLIPEGDFELYKVKLAQLMQDQNLSNKFGKAARKKIVDDFNIDSISKKFLDVLGKVNQ